MRACHPAQPALELVGRALPHGGKASADSSLLRMLRRLQGGFQTREFSKHRILKFLSRGYVKAFADFPLGRARPFVTGGDAIFHQSASPFIGQDSGPEE